MGSISYLLREYLLDESIVNIGDLPDDTALFIRDKGWISELDLYSPNSEVSFATITLNTFKKSSNAYQVGGVAAISGYGTLMYNLALMYAYTKNIYLMPSRDGDVRSKAWYIWVKIFNDNTINKKTLEVNDDNFRFDILFGDEVSEDEKEETWLSLDDKQKNTLTIFNTMYNKQPTNIYNELVSRSKQYPKEIFFKANDSGNELFDSLYH
jgi:hypothetical protein